MGCGKITALVTGLAAAATLTGCGLDIMAPRPPTPPPLIGAARVAPLVTAAAPASAVAPAPGAAPATSAGETMTTAASPEAVPTPAAAVADASQPKFPDLISWFTSVLYRKPPPAPPPVRLGW